jgi:DNA modification methylase
MTIINGNALNIPLADGSVQTCVTSPPYFGLRDYGVAGQIGLEQTPDAYVAQLVAVFREVWRVLRDDGTLWLNLGDSYNSGASGSLEGSTITGGQANQARSNRTGKKIVCDVKHKDMIGIPWRVAFALQAEGWYLRSDIIWSKPNPMPESVTDRPTKAHEYMFLLSKSAKYYYDAEAVQEKAGSIVVMKGMLGKKGGTDRNDAHNMTGGHSVKSDDATRNKRSVWTVATKPYSGAHFATFPPELITPCILAGAPEGGIVLDPFSGSGTTVATARQLGRVGIGIELNTEYIGLAQERNQQMTVWESM